MVGGARRGNPAGRSMLAAPSCRTILVVLGVLVCQVHQIGALPGLWQECRLPTVDDLPLGQHSSLEPNDNGISFQIYAVGSGEPATTFWPGDMYEVKVATDKPTKAILLASSGIFFGSEDCDMRKMTYSITGPDKSAMWMAPKESTDVIFSVNAAAGASANYQQNMVSLARASEYSEPRSAPESTGGSMIAIPQAPARNAEQESAADATPLPYLAATAESTPLPSLFATPLPTSVPTPDATPSGTIPWLFTPLPTDRSQPEVTPEATQPWESPEATQPWESATTLLPTDGPPVEATPHATPSGTIPWLFTPLPTERSQPEVTPEATQPWESPEATQPWESVTTLPTDGPPVEATPHATPSGTLPWLLTPLPTERSQPEVTPEATQPWESPEATQPWESVTTLPTDGPPVEATPAATGPLVETPMPTDRLVPEATESGTPVSTPEPPEGPSDTFLPAITQAPPLGATPDTTAVTMHTTPLSSAGPPEDGQPEATPPVATEVPTPSATPATTDAPLPQPTASITSTSQPTPSPSTPEPTPSPTSAPEPTPSPTSAPQPTPSPTSKPQPKPSPTSAKANSFAPNPSILSRQVMYVVPACGDFVRFVGVLSFNMDDIATDQPDAIAQANEYAAKYEVLLKSIFGENKAFINGTQILERITESTYANGTIGQSSSLGKIDIETILVGDSLEEAQTMFNTVRASSWARQIFTAEDFPGLQRPRLSGVQVDPITDQTCPDPPTAPPSGPPPGEFCAGVIPPYLCATTHFTQLSFSDIEMDLIGFESNFISNVSSALGVNPDTVLFSGLRFPAQGNGVFFDWQYIPNSNAEVRNAEVILRDGTAFTGLEGAYGPTEINDITAGFLEVATPPPAVETPSSTPAPTTPAPTTPAPSTPAPTPAPTTPAPTTPAPSTPAPTPAPTTPAPSTSAPTPAPTTPAPSTSAPTPAPTTPAPTTPAPSTPAPTTPTPTTPALTTPAPSTTAPTPAPTTPAPTTPAPSTAAPTPAPTTPAPTTPAPSTTAPTPAPTTPAPSTTAPTTPVPTTPALTTPAPTTPALTTPAPTTPAPTTPAPSTPAPTTPAPTTPALTTPAPSTTAPTPGPTTPAPTTPAPSTTAPTPGPTTPAPTTPAPSTTAPTPGPTTPAPTTPAPSTIAPTPAGTPTPTPVPATPDPTPTGICAGSTPPYVCAASVFPLIQYLAVEDDLPNFQADFIGNLSSSLGFAPEAIEVTALRRAYDPRGSMAVDWTLNATANQEALDVEAVLGDSGADLLGGMLSPWGPSETRGIEVVLAPTPAPTPAPATPDPTPTGICAGSTPPYVCAASVFPQLQYSAVEDDLPSFQAAFIGNLSSSLGFAPEAIEVTALRRADPRGSMAVDWTLNATANQEALDVEAVLGDSGADLLGGMLSPYGPSETRGIEVVLAPTPAPTPAPATPDPTPTGICAGSTPPYVCAASVFPQLQYSAVEDDLPSFQADFVGNLSSSLGFTPEAIEVTAIRRVFDPRGSMAVDWTLNATANQEALGVEAVLGDSGADLLGGMLSPYGPSETRGIEVVLAPTPAPTPAPATPDPTPTGICAGSTPPYVCAASVFPQLQYSAVEDDLPSFEAAFIDNLSSSLGFAPEIIEVTAIRRAFDPRGSMAVDWTLNATANQEALDVEDMLGDSKTDLLGGMLSPYGPSETRGIEVVLAPTPAPTPAPATPDPTPTGICAGSTPPYVCAASVFPQLQYSAVEDDLPSFQAAFIGNLSSSLGFAPEAIEVTALRRAYDPRGSMAVDWTLNATANQEALDVDSVLGDSGADLLGGMLSPYGPSGTRDIEVVLAPTPLPTPSPTTSPTASPTLSPTMAPTMAPTASPTMAPTVSPTMAPTASPTSSPTAAVAVCSDNPPPFVCASTPFTDAEIDSIEDFEAAFAASTSRALNVSLDAVSISQLRGPSTGGDGDIQVDWWVAAQDNDEAVAIGSLLQDRDTMLLSDLEATYGKTSDTSNVEVVLEHLPAKCLATEAPFVCAVASFPELQYADIAGEDKERFIAAFVANASDSLDVKPEDVYVTAVRSLADPLNSVAADWWVNASSNNEARVIDQTLIDRRSGVLNGASDEYGPSFMSDVRLGLIPDDTIPDWCAQADQPPFVCATSELEDISYEDVESSLVSYELEFVRAVAATLDVAPEDVEIRDVRPASVADIGLGVDWLVRASTNADALEYDSTLQDPERGALSMPTGAYGDVTTRNVHEVLASYPPPPPPPPPMAPGFCVGNEPPFVCAISTFPSLILEDVLEIEEELQAVFVSNVSQALNVSADSIVIEEIRASEAGGIAVDWWVQATNNQQAQAINNLLRLDNPVLEDLFPAYGTTDLSGVYPRYVPIASERGTPSPPNNYTDPDLRSWQQNAALIAGVAAAVALLALLLVCCCLFFLFSRQRAAQRIQGYTYYPPSQFPI